MACSAHRARRRWQEGSSTRLLRAKGDASLSSLASRSGSMDLYYSPGACSLGIHVLMEEIGKPEGQLEGRRAAQAGVPEDQPEGEGADAGARRWLRTDGVRHGSL